MVDVRWVRQDGHSADMKAGIRCVFEFGAHGEVQPVFESGGYWRFQPQEKNFFSLATFYNVYQDIRSVEPGPNVLPFTFGNGVKGRTYGAELSAAYRLVSWWRLRGGYTYLRKKLSLKPASHDGNAGSQKATIPITSILFNP